MQLAGRGPDRRGSTTGRSRGHLPGKLVRTGGLRVRRFEGRGGFSIGESVDENTEAHAHSE